MCGFMKLAAAAELTLVVMEKALHLDGVLPLGGSHTAQMAIVFGIACVLEELHDIYRRQIERVLTRARREGERDELHLLVLASLREREAASHERIEVAARLAVQEMTRKAPLPPEA